jgi:hypothetical protein
LAVADHRSTRGGRRAFGLAVLFLLVLCPLFYQGGALQWPPLSGPRCSYGQVISIASQVIALKNWQDAFDEEMPAIMEGVKELTAGDGNCDYRKVKRARSATDRVFRTKEEVSTGLNQLIHALESGRITGVGQNDLQEVERRLNHNIAFLEKHRDESRFFGKVLDEQRTMLKRLDSLRASSDQAMVDAQTALKFFELAALFVEFSYAQLGLVDEMLKQASEGRVIQEAMFQGSLEDLASRLLSNNYEYIDISNKLFAQLQRQGRQSPENLVVEGRPYSRVVRASGSCPFNGVQSRDDAQICAEVEALRNLTAAVGNAYLTVSGKTRNVRHNHIVRGYRVIESKISSAAREVTVTVEAYERDIVPLSR